MQKSANLLRVTLIFSFCVCNRRIRTHCSVHIHVELIGSLSSRVQHVRANTTNILIGAERTGNDVILNKIDNLRFRKETTVENNS